MSLNSFYKYYDADTAIKYVLGQGTIKWSTPFEFNDPFDNQFELQLENVTDDLIDKLVPHFKNTDLWGQFQIVLPGLEEPLNCKDLCSQAADHLSSEQWRELARKGIEDFKLSEFCKIFQFEMSHSAIFCLSETFDNTKMWAHYADNHKGVVLKFKPADPDSPLPLAKQIRYVSEMPILKYGDFLDSSKDVDTKIKELIDLYTLTKTSEWSEEREWRIVTLTRNLDKKSMCLEFNPHEIQEVYLGCNIGPKNKQEVLDIVASQYPWAEIYQGRKSTSSFSIEFDKIL